MFSFFSKSRQKEGWLALNPTAEGVCSASVRRVAGAKPEVVSCAQYPVDFLKSGDLESVVKGMNLKKVRATTLLRPGEYQLYVVEAPKVPEQEMSAAIRWRVKDLMDYSIDDATVSVLDIPTDKYAPGRMRSMYVVTARNEIVQQRVNLFDQARIPLYAIDIPELAQRNLALLLEQEGMALAMLSFDRDGGLLTFSCDGELYLARRIEVADQQLREADEESRQQFFNRITLELQRSLDYFDRQLHFIPLGRLLLAPVPPAGLQEHLAANLSLPVETFDLEAIFDLSGVPEMRQPERQGSCFLTLGTALRFEGEAA